MDGGNGATVRVIADRDRCIGSGQCALTAPDLFDSDDDGLVDVLDAEPDPSRLAAVREAVALCPARALRLEENPDAVRARPRG